MRRVSTPSGPPIMPGKALVDRCSAAWKGVFETPVESAGDIVLSRLVVEVAGSSSALAGRTRWTPPPKKNRIKAYIQTKFIASKHFRSLEDFYGRLKRGESTQSTWQALQWHAFGTSSCGSSFLWEPGVALSQLYFTFWMCCKMSSLLYL